MSGVCDKFLLKWLTTLYSSAKGNTGYVDLIINFHIDFSIIYLYSYFSFLSRSHHSCFHILSSHYFYSMDHIKHGVEWGATELKWHDHWQMITERKKKKKSQEELQSFCHPLAVGLTPQSASYNGGFEGREGPCHQRGGGGGSFFVGAVLVVVFVVLVAGVVSFRLRFSSATSKVMTSTQPMASKSAKFRNEPWQSSSSSEEEAEASSSGNSVDSSSSVTNRLLSAHWASHAWRSASDSRGSFSLHRERQKEWWE